MSTLVGQTVSHYRILEHLGSGGMGVVYRAEDTRLKRTVALKFLPPELTRDPEAKERFIHEAQAASALQHNNICTVHDIDETPEGQLFIVMDLYDGETLKKKIERGPLKIDDAIDIAAQVAQGLVEAHGQGIIHRDIKPANVLVTKSNVAKIVDFGLAKLSNRTMLTKTGSRIGTAAYMSPEQARGEQVDQRTDIWSLGVVLYEMITGRRPFNSDYEQALVYSILNDSPTPPEKLRPSVPAQLGQVVEGALQKSPDQRYTSMDRLLSELRSVKQKLEPGHDEPHAQVTKNLPSIAVLPFTNMSADPENEYFGNGLAEEVINALSQLEGLHVTARTSAFRFRGGNLDIREVGQQLNVGTVLEGSVRKSGSRLRITAQLINVTDGYHLWSERYDRELRDIFAIQDEISAAIVQKLRVRLLGEDRARLAKHFTDDFEVYDHYLRGRYYLNTLAGDAIAKSLVHFQQAVQKDPGYAPGHAGMAAAYVVQAVLMLVPSGEVLPRAQQLLARALELDESLAEAHAWLGEVHLIYNWDWAAAERELTRAIELQPNSSEAHQMYSDYLIVTGRMDAARAEIERARALDPLSAIPQTILAYLFYVSREPDRAIKHCTAMLEIAPNHLLQAHLWRSLHQMNRFDEALVECKKLISLFVSDEIAGVMERHGGQSQYRSAMMAAAQALGELTKHRHVSPILIATLFTHAEDDDETLRWLERAYEERDQTFYTIAVDPDWDRVRSHPRFVQLLEKLRLEV